MAAEQLLYTQYYRNIQELAALGNFLGSFEESIATHISQESCFSLEGGPVSCVDELGTCLTTGGALGMKLAVIIIICVERVRLGPAKIEASLY